MVRRMRINVAGVMLAGSVWLTAVILAWAARHPYIALVVLGVHGALVTALGALTDNG